MGRGVWIAACKGVFMFQPFRIMWWCLPLLAMLPLSMQQARAASLNCRFDVDNLLFGTINVLTGASVSTTGNVQIRCRGNPNQWVTICPNIGSGTGNPTAYDPRQMDKWGSSTAKLNFNIFWPTSSAIWGSFLWPYPPTPPVFHIQLDSSGRNTVNRSMPATIFGGQYGAIPGTYISRFRNSHVAFQYQDGIHAQCTAPAGTRTPRFRVRAKVDKACEVSATDLDFGAVGNLDNAVDATATITVRCTNTTPYKVRIDGGNTGTTNPTNRKMSNGAYDITYGIYRDAARTQGWGRWNSNDVDATGTGYPQTFTAYGRVPVQPTPPPGTYIDTLVVSVVF